MNSEQDIAMQSSTETREKINPPKKSLRRLTKKSSIISFFIGAIIGVVSTIVFVECKDLLYDMYTDSLYDNYVSELVDEPIPQVERISKDPLYEFLGQPSSLFPTDNTGYKNTGNMVRVFQTLPDGVLATSEHEFYGGIIKIRTKKKYVDDALVVNGLYVFNGYYEYETVKGSNKRVYMFAEVER